MTFTGKVAPVLCMVLLYISLNLGRSVAALLPSGKEQSLLWGLCHFALALGTSLAAGIYWRRRFHGTFAACPDASTAAPPFDSRAGSRSGGVLPRGTAFICFALAALALASHAEGLVTGAHTLFPLWIPASTLGIFWPFVFTIFFSSVPRAHYAFTLGLCMAGGEMAWVALLPFLQVIAPGMPSPEQAAHLYLFQGMVQAAIGVGLALLIAGRTPGNRFAAAPHTLRNRPQNHPDGCPDNQPTGRPQPPGRSIVAALFVCGLLYFMLFGLGMGHSFPRIALDSGVSSSIYFAALAAPPLAGLLIDKSPRHVLALLVFLAVAACYAAAASVFPHLRGGSCPALILSLGRTAVFLLLYSMLARLPASPFFPFLTACVHALFLAQPLGVAAGTLGGPAAGPVIAVCFVLAALGLALLLLRRPDLWEPLPEREAASEASAKDGTDGTADGNSGKLRAFTLAFCLTGREEELLAGLTRGGDPGTLAANLGISERTVRFHLTGLLRKTGAHSRRRLLLFYREWPPPS